ncbi:MAG: tetraacyldisaccharide 4'-kinase [Paracoccaceae bacterium]
MRPPGFWYRPPASPGLLPRLLAPISLAVAAATRRRVARTGQRAGVPVICAGNINTGGAGKTPAVIALLQHLAARGVKAHALSRGYGGRESGPLRVDPSAHGAGDVGDEPLLIAAFAPCWVSRDRAAGAQAAIRGGAQALVLDDGFQNPALEKDIPILVIDAGQGFGNGRVVPAGPLREPVAAGLARAGLVLTIGSQEERARVHADWPELSAIPEMTGRLEPLRTGMDWRRTRLFAFAGIGRPEKFFATLRALGADVAGTRALADHAPLSPRLMKRLDSEARAMSAQLVTTEKDSVRLPKGWNSRVLTLPVRLAVADWSALDRKLDELGL